MPEIPAIGRASQGDPKFHIPDLHSETLILLTVIGFLNQLFEDFIQCILVISLQRFLLTPNQIHPQLLGVVCLFVCFLTHPVQFLMSILSWVWCHPHPGQKIHGGVRARKTISIMSSFPTRVHYVHLILPHRLRLFCKYYLIMARILNTRRTFFF